MKKLFTTFFFAISTGLLAVTPVPYSEGVSFSSKITGTGATTMTVQGETTVVISDSVSSGTHESDITTVWLRPGKQYPVTFAGGNSISQYWMSFTAPQGYAVYINNLATDLYTVSGLSGSFSHTSYTVEIRPIASASGAATGTFSGIELGETISWEVSLGNLRTGRSAGKILFRERDLSNSPVSRERLYYAAPPANIGQISVIKDGASAQTLRQVCTPVGFVDIVDDEDGGYWFKFYTWGQATWNGTVYTFTGSAWKTIRVESPAASQLRITEKVGTGPDRVSLLTGSAVTSSSTGGTITTSGGYTIHTFNSGGTFAAASALTNVDYLVVGGGGGGGNATNATSGGGGGGDVEYVTGASLSATSYSVTVGAGGASATAGSNSVFNSVTAYGGGRGGSATSGAATSGGSGGGGNTNTAGAAAGSGNHVYGGGAGDNGSHTWPGGGGGGAGGTGGGLATGIFNGGVGFQCAISGTTAYYGGGGGGGAYNSSNATYGGSGGGGGCPLGQAGGNGTANTGGGGGGAGADSNSGLSYNGGAGGSGVVIIRYPTNGTAVYNTWTLKEGDGTTWLRTVTHQSSITAAGQRDVIASVYTGDSTSSSDLVARTKYHYVTQAWGDELSQIVVDPDAAALTTTYDYHTTASAYGNYRKVKSITEPTGNWTAFEYYDDWDKRGQLKYEFHPYLDSPSTAASVSTATGRVVYFEYAADWTGRHRKPSLRQEKINNVETGRTTWTPDNTNSARDMTDVYYYRDSSNNHTDRMESIRGDNSDSDAAGQPYQVKKADQTHTVWSVSRGTYNPSTKAFAVDNSTGDHWRELKFNGTTGSGTPVTTYDGQSCESVNLVANKSTLEVTIRIAQGVVYRTETRVYNGSGFDLLTSEDFTYDNYGRLTQRFANNGAMTTFAYTDGLISSTVDPSATETQFVYDEIGRVKRQMKVGASALTVDSITHAAQDPIYTYFEYDGANRVRKTIVSASSTKPTTPGDLDLVSTATYDLAGRLTQEVQFFGSANSLTTGNAYSSGGKIVTTTLPGGGTRITEVFLDGQPKSVTGTGVVNEFASYSVDSGTGQRVQVQRPVSTTYGATVTTTFDWLGRPLTIARPAWSSGTMTQTNYYNNSGQLWKVTRPGLASTLYTYDSLGVLFREGLDVTSSGDTLADASDDRITEHHWEFFPSSGMWRRDTTKTYASAGSGTVTTLGKVETKLSDLGTDVASLVKTYDVFGNVTTQTVVIDRANKKVTTTTDLPDSSTDLRQIVHNGLPVESRDQSGIIIRSIYDVLGRPSKVVDPRTADGASLYGTVTAYQAKTSLVASITDPAGKTQATYEYDSAGRLSKVTDALGKVARYDYNERGQRLHEWGQTTYPVEYVYDDLGRVSIQKTYRGASNLNASTWASVTKGTADPTKWIYDENTGLLKEKYDAANLDSTFAPISGAKKVTYTYTSAGQLYERTWARNVKTTYGYSSTTGELLTVNYADSTPDVTYTYNRLGQTATVADRIGTRTFNYNLGGTLELQSEDLPSPLTSRRMTYPRATSGVVGRPTGLQLGTSGSPTTDLNISYDYDTYGRFNTFDVRNSGGTVLQTFTYGYATNSNLIGTVSNSGLNYTDTRTYDSRNNWIDERKTTWGTTPDIKAKFAYNQDDMGRVLDVTKTEGMFSGYGAGSTKGLKTSYTYTDRSELYTENTTDLAGSPDDIHGRQATYTYDELGNRKSVTKARDSGNAGGNLTFDYSPSGYEINSLNQYQRRTVPGIYDVAAISTASSVTVDGSAMEKQGTFFFRGHPLDNSTAPILDTLTVAPSGGSSEDRSAFLPKANEDFTYDDDGNLLSDGRWNYTYDAENRLITMETIAVAVTAGVTRQRVSFGYDYLGRRVSKAVEEGWNAGTSTYDTLLLWERYIYDGWNCIAAGEVDSGTNGTVIDRKYYWGLDLSGSKQGAGGVGGLLMTQEGGNTYLPAYDAMGNVHAMMTAANVTLGGTNYVAGDIVAAYEYDAFGNTLRESGPYAAANPFRFATKYTDIETGLVYHETRYYSPSLGRFITRDSIGEQGGLNLYAYVSNRVPNAWDYLGQLPVGARPGDDFEPLDSGREYTGGSLSGGFLTSFNNGYGDNDGPGTGDDLVTVLGKAFKGLVNLLNPPEPVGPINTWNNATNSFIDGTGGNPVALDPYHVTADRAPNSGGNNTNPWELGVQWLTGTGPRNQSFRDGDPMTQLLQQHSHIQDTRNTIANNIANGGDLQGRNNYGLGGLAGVPKYLKDYSTLATAGQTGNLAVTYLGSYRLNWQVTEVSLENQTATVVFHVENSSTINSATHPPVIGYTQTWNTYIGEPLNRYFSSGPMSQTTQTFDWTETITWPPKN